jgi:hypothetical protein
LASIDEIDVRNVGRVTAGGDKRRRRAPAAKPSSSATATKTVINWKRSIGYSGKRNEQL